MARRLARTDRAAGLRLYSSQSVFHLMDLYVALRFFYPKNHDKRTEEQTGEQTSKVFADSVQRSLAEAVSGSETKEALTKNDIFLFLAR